MPHAVGTNFWEAGQGAGSGHSPLCISMGKQKFHRSPKKRGRGIFKACGLLRTFTVSLSEIISHWNKKQHMNWQLTNVTTPILEL